MYRHICDAIHRELDEFDQKFADGARIGAQELEHIDTMVHALKSMATYEAMTERERNRPSRYSDSEGYSRRYY